MKTITKSTIYLIMSLLIFTAESNANSQKLPVIKGKEVVALVNNEPITMEEFSRSLASIEHESTEGEAEAAKIDYAGILDRLIDEKLFLHEAMNIGIHELPEVRSAVDQNAQSILARLLVKKELKETEADQEEVERLYKEAIKELKMSSVVFEKESDASEMAEQIKSGKRFDELAKRAVDEGKVKESLEGEYLKYRDLWPQVAEAVAEMDKGSVSGIIPLGNAFLIFSLEDIRYTDDPVIKERIIRSSMRNQREIALYEYSDSLIKKYVTINDAVFDSVNYDISVEEFDKLLKDDSVIAKVRGGEAVTVGELTESFKDKFYHGVSDHIKRKKLNDRKKEVLEKILQKKVFVIEAKKQRLDMTDSYKEKLDNFKNSLVLGSFIEKVVTRGIKLNEKELMAYYEDNAGDYMYPEMMRLRSLAFYTKDNAKDAIAKLRKGTDFKWFSENAEGQVAKDAKGLMVFEGSILGTHNLPEDIHTLLHGVESEDYRLYTSPEEYNYVLYVQDVYPARQKGYEEVKKELAEKIYNDKIKKELKEWSDKLKEHYKVEIYLTKF